MYAGVRNYRRGLVPKGLSKAFLLTSVLFQATHTLSSLLSNVRMITFGNDLQTVTNHSWRVIKHFIIIRAAISCFVLLPGQPAGIKPFLRD